jgi:hypothetical protein
MIKVKVFKWVNNGLEVIESFWNDHHAAIAYAKESGYKAKVFDHSGEVLHSTEAAQDTYA